MQKKDIDRINLPPEAGHGGVKKERKLSQRFSQVFSSVIYDEGNAPKGVFQGAPTMNKIDSCTENYINPMDTYVQSQGMVANDLHKLDNPNGIDLDPSLQNIEDEMLEEAGITHDPNMGIMQDIVSRLIAAGRFKFKKLREFRKDLAPPKLTNAIRGVQRISRGVVTCRRLKVVSRQASIRMQARKLAGAPFNEFTTPMYTEKIKLAPQGLVKLIKNGDQFFDKYIKNEATALPLVEILLSIVKTCIIGVNSNFTPILNIPKRNVNIFWSIIMENKNFIMILFDNYLSKLNFALENKVTFGSAIVSGEIFNLMIKNFDKICTDKETKLDLLNTLKKNLTLMSDYLCKSQYMYRRLLRDETLRYFFSNNQKLDSQVHSQFYR
jgi:hypothetical protein